MSLEQTNRALFLEKRNNPPELQAFRQSEAILNLEHKYGHILYLPLDLPPLRPTDPVAFKEWWKQHAKLISKAGTEHKTVNTGLFKAVTSPNLKSPFWEDNPHDVLAVFPEFRAALDALPYQETTTPEFTLLQSQRRVGMHRDEGPYYDFPCSFRFLVIDENPQPVFRICEQLPETPLPYIETMTKPHHVIPRVPDTTALAWHNLRSSHGTIYNPNYMKVLLVPSYGQLDPKKYDDLMERSIKKYGHLMLTTIHPQSRWL